MNDIFVDGIRSIGVANGVVRIEFAQLRRSEDGGEAKMVPQPVANVIIPANSLAAVLKQMTDTLRQIQEQAKAQQPSEPTIP